MNGNREDEELREKKNKQKSEEQRWNLNILIHLQFQKSGKNDTQAAKKEQKGEDPAGIIGGFDIIMHKETDQLPHKIMIDENSLRAHWSAPF